MSIPPATMTTTTTTTTTGFPKNAMLCFLFISLSAVAAVSSEAAQRACSKGETTLPVPVPAKDKNSSGVIRTIRAALKPDREGISNANIYHGGATVVTAPVTTTGGLPSPQPPQPPPVISYAAMAS